MAEMHIGGAPGAVYTETEALQGKCPALGALYTDHNGNKYVMVKTTTGNLTNGTLVTIANDWAATAAAAGNGPTAASTIGVLVVSVTTSTSTLCWAQVFGKGNVLASTSALPNVVLGIGSAGGQVDDGVTTASVAITGMHLTATSQSASALTACILNFPTLYSNI